MSFDAGRWSTAVHEAGHALAYVHLLGPESIAKVTIIPDCDFEGHVAKSPALKCSVTQAFRSAPQDDRDDLLARLILCVYAGPAAELRVHPSSESALVCFSDVSPEEEAEVDRWIAEGKDGPLATFDQIDDHTQAEILLALLAPDRKMRAELARPPVRQGGRLFVADHWVEVEALAKALLLRRTLSGVQVARVLRRAAAHAASPTVP